MVKACCWRVFEFNDAAIQLRLTQTTKQKSTEQPNKTNQDTELLTSTNNCAHTRCGRMIMPLFKNMHSMVAEVAGIHNTLSSTGFSSGKRKRKKGTVCISEST